MITSFAVANGIGVPLTGWLMGRYGVVKTFTFSVLLFTLASSATSVFAAGTPSPPKPTPILACSRSLAFRLCRLYRFRSLNAHARPRPFP